MGIETKISGHQLIVEEEDRETPKGLEIELKKNYTQEPTEELIYKEIEQKVAEENFLEAKKQVAELLKEYMRANKGLSIELKAFIAADWYKSTPLPKENREKEQDDKSEVSTYNDLAVIVVGRNFPKRIINVAWGRGQEGFFKWHFRKPLPEYNDLLRLSFDQKQERGIMFVHSADKLEGEANFQDDFYRIEEVCLEQNEEGQWLYNGQTLAPYLFAKQNIEALTTEDKVNIHLIYKYLPREKDFSWSIAKLILPEHLQVLDSKEEDKEQETQEEATKNAETKAKCTAEIVADTSVVTETEVEPKPAVRESHSLIINDIPLRNGELTCRCLTNKNELIYFRKSLTQMDINRLDKLEISGLVREEDFGKQFIKIEQIKLAKDEDFPKTILRKTLKRLHKEDNNIFLDNEQLASRKVQILRLKHLMMKANSNDFPVWVEEMYLYAVHIKDYEWTISDVKLAQEDGETKATDTEDKKDTDPKEKAKQEQALRQPWQIRVAYITKVDKVRGRVEMVYGVRKKGYISLNDFPINTPYEGDWLGMKMLDGKEPMHEIVFNDIIRLDPNKRLPNTCKLIYKVRRGMLWYSEQDHIFKLHNAPISQDLVLAMDNPEYKDYFLVEELLDYDEEKKEFAWRPIKIEKFEYLDNLGEAENNIYPMKFRQKALFEKAIENLQALSPKSLKEKPTKAKKEKAIENPTPIYKEAMVASLPADTTLATSFCPQRVSRLRQALRGPRGLSAKRKG